MRSLLTVFFLFVSVSAYSNDECLIYDEYGLETKAVADILKDKGFVITEKFPYGQEYFVFHKNLLWNDSVTDALRSELYCFEISIKTHGIRSTGRLSHSSLNFQSVDKKVSGLFFKCSSTSDLKFKQRKKQSLREAVQEFEECEKYLKDLKEI